MARVSSGSAAPGSANWLTSCRNAALSSRVTFASRAITRPSPVRTSGLTSTSVASSPVNTAQSRSASSAAPARASSGSLPAATISAALAASTPVSGLTGILASASGFVLATSSISTPPSTEHIDRNVRSARSSRNDR